MSKPVQRDSDARQILELSGFNWLILSKLTAALSFWAPIGFSRGWRNISFSCRTHLCGKYSLSKWFADRVNSKLLCEIIAFWPQFFPQQPWKSYVMNVWEKLTGLGRNLCFLCPAKGLFPWFEIRDETVRMIFDCSSIYVCFNSFVNVFSACSVDKMCLLQRTECEERQPLVVKEWADMKLKDAVG